MKNIVLILWLFFLVQGSAQEMNEIIPRLLQSYSQCENFVVRATFEQTFYKNNEKSFSKKGSFSIDFDRSSGAFSLFHKTIAGRFFPEKTVRIDRGDWHEMATILDKSGDKVLLEKSLEFDRALAGVIGVTNGISFFFPRLLFEDKFEGRNLFERADSMQLVGKEKFQGRECFIVKIINHKKQSSKPYNQILLNQLKIKVREDGNLVEPIKWEYIYYIRTDNFRIAKIEETLNKESTAVKLVTIIK